MVQDVTNPKSPLQEKGLPCAVPWSATHLALLIGGLRLQLQPAPGCLQLEARSPLLGAAIRNHRPNNGDGVLIRVLAGSPAHTSTPARSAAATAALMKPSFPPPVPDTPPSHTSPAPAFSSARVRTLGFCPRKISCIWSILLFQGTHHYSFLGVRPRRDARAATRRRPSMLQALAPRLVRSILLKRSPKTVRGRKDAQRMYHGRGAGSCRAPSVCACIYHGLPLSRCELGQGRTPPHMSSHGPHPTTPTPM